MPDGDDEEGGGEDIDPTPTPPLAEDDAEEKHDEGKEQKEENDGLEAMEADDKQGEANADAGAAEEPPQAEEAAAPAEELPPAEEGEPDSETDSDEEPAELTDVLTAAIKRGKYGLDEQSLHMIRRLDFRKCYLGKGHMPTKLEWRRVPSVRHLGLRQVKGLTPEEMTHATRGCKKLRSIDLRRAPTVTPELLAVIKKRCPKLKKLDLWGCSAETFTPGAVAALAEKCTRLTRP